MCGKLYTADLKRIGPSARSSHQCCVVVDENDKNEYDLYLYGGGWESPDGRRFKQFDDLWAYNSKSETWKNLTYSHENDKKTINQPQSRNGHRMVYFQDNLYIFGGF